MSPVVIVAIVAVCLSLGVLAWLLLGGSGPARRRSLDNLQRGLDATPKPAVGAAGRRRGGFTSLAVGLTPRRLQSYLDGLLTRAGRPPSWPVERVVAAKLGLLLGALVLGFGLIRFSAHPVSFGLAGFLALLAFFFPDLRLYSRGIERRRAISLQLPDTLDQMSIAVHAGLGFDSAMVRVARNGHGELAAEMIRAMQDIQVGQPRRVAYTDLADRCGVPELRRFMRAIVAAETYGLALADVLHTQADELRVQRRQRAEMKAMEIPVKVVFPLIVCIMPALFIVLVGPAAIRIAGALSLLSGG